MFVAKFLSVDFEGTLYNSVKLILDNIFIRKTFYVKVVY